MILAMGKRKKKTVRKKALPERTESPKPEKEADFILEENALMQGMGILPSRDLKKNLGCG